MFTVYTYEIIEIMAKTPDKNPNNLADLIRTTIKDTVLNFCPEGGDCGFKSSFRNIIALEPPQNLILNLVWTQNPSISQLFNIFLSISNEMDL